MIRFVHEVVYALTIDGLLADIFKGLNGALDYAENRFGLTLDDFTIGHHKTGDSWVWKDCVTLEIREMKLK